MHHTGTDSCYFSYNNDVTFVIRTSGNGFTHPSHTERNSL